VSGYTVDGWGGIHPFGGAPPVAVTTNFQRDIVRSIVLRRDGLGGYTLDSQGGMHEFGGAPPVQVTFTV
jgi:hypothetical protein